MVDVDLVVNIAPDMILFLLIMSLFSESEFLLLKVWFAQQQFIIMESYKDFERDPFYSNSSESAGL